MISEICLVNLYRESVFGAMRIILLGILWEKKSCLPETAKEHSTRHIRKGEPIWLNPKAVGSDASS